LQGFFDAEGSIVWSSAHRVELSLTNTDRDLLERLRIALSKSGYYSKVRLKGHSRLGIGDSPMWALVIWRFYDVRDLLREIPLQHPEKKAKARIALTLNYGESEFARSRSTRKWTDLLEQIRVDRDLFVKCAQSLLSPSVDN
jgi:intein-encoded DNA endonuclease-like protein